MLDSDSRKHGTVVHNEPNREVLDHSRLCCPLVAYYDFLGTVISVYSNDPASLDEVHRVFRGFQVASPGPGESASFYLYCEEGPRPYRFVNPEGRYVESAQWKPAFFHLITRVHSHVWASQPRLLPLHSAAMSFQGHGVLLPGEGGGGKSTLALELALCGFEYLSDEYAPIEINRLQVLPFPRPLQASADVIEKLLGKQGEGLLQEPPLPDDDETPRYLVYPGDWFSVGQPCPVHYIFFLTLDAEPSGRLEAIAKAEALAGLARSALVYHEDPAWRRQAAETLISLVAGANCYRLRLGEIGRNAKLVRDLIVETEGRVPKGRDPDFDLVSERVRQLL